MKIKEAKIINIKQKIALMIRMLGITVISLQVTACGAMMGEKGPYGLLSPTPMLLRGLPQGDDSFSKGFRDGCYNFIGQNGYGLQRIYDIPPAPEYVLDNLYKQGYLEGDRYCGVFVNKGITL